MFHEFSSHDDLIEYFENNEFLYIIYSEYGCKIGRSNNPNQRLEQIRLNLPSQKACFVGLYRGRDCAIFEKKLHKKLNNRNISGEWFILSQHTLDYIHDFLTSNHFLCIQKISVLWANYLIPSIYLKGNIRVVYTERDNVDHGGMKHYPESLKKLIQFPKYDENGKIICEYFTATALSEKLKKYDFDLNPIELGKYLKGRGFKNKSRKIDNIGVRKVYALFIDIGAI